MGNMIRIANGQGFWGDSLEAPLEQIRRGPIDYLTLDYLAEITMSILQKQRSRDPRSGYARDFVEMIGRGAGDLLARKIRVVANAGGVNPAACRSAVARPKPARVLARAHRQFRNQGSRHSCRRQAGSHPVHRWQRRSLGPERVVGERLAAFVA